MTTLRREAPPRFTPDQVDEALQLLLFQRDYFTSVSEDVAFGWTETRREVVATFTLPTASEGEGEGEGAVTLVPLIMPEKNQLVSISNVHCPDGSPVRLLSHDEHSQLAREMIRVLFFYVYAQAGLPLEGDTSISGPAALLKKLEEIPNLDRKHAQASLNTMLARDRFTEIDVALRPGIEADLAELCRILADRYLIVARVSPKTSGECRIAWTVTDPNPLRDDPVDFRSRAKMLVGDHPQNVRLSAPYARLTDDYHIRVVAPEDHYAYSSRAVWSPDNWRRRSDADLDDEPVPGSPLKKLGSATLPEDPTHRVRQAHLGGAVPTAHVYVSGGSRTAEAIDVEIVWQEFPIGSIGGPLLGAFLTAVLATALIAARHLDFAATLPATFVAVALSATVSPAIALMSRAPARPSLMSRTVSFFLSLTALAYALWWALPSAENAANALSSWRYAATGWLITTSLVIVALVAGVRARKVVKNYNRARDGSIVHS